MNKGPWYNTSVCSKFPGKLFEYFIAHEITDRYYLVCSIIAHDKKQPSYEDEEISIGDSPIPKSVAAEAFEALGTTLNVIDIFLKILTTIMK